MSSACSSAVISCFTTFEVNAFKMASNLAFVWIKSSMNCLLILPSDDSPPPKAGLRDSISPRPPRRSIPLDSRGSSFPPPPPFLKHQLQSTGRLPFGLNGTSQGLSHSAQIALNFGLSEKLRSLPRSQELELPNLFPPFQPPELLPLRGLNMCLFLYPLVEITEHSLYQGKKQGFGVCVHPHKPVDLVLLHSDIPENGDIYDCC